MRRWTAAAALLGSHLILFPGPRLVQAQAGPGEPSESDDTRTAELEAKRRAHAETVKPVKKSRLVEMLTNVENEGVDQYISVQAKGFRLGFGQISPLSSLSPAIRYEQPRIGHTELSLWVSGSYSLRGYQDYELQFGWFDKPEPPDHRATAVFGVPFEFDRRTQRPNQNFLYGEVRYANFPQERFFGLGNDSSEDDHTDFRLEDTDIRAVAGFQLARWFALGGHAGYLLTNVGPGTNDEHPDTDQQFDDDAVPGVSDQPDFVHYDGRILLAYEGDPNLPAAEIGLSFARFDQSEGNRFRFNRYALDARGFLPLGSRQRTLAARAWLSRDEADDGSEVPFYLMKTLGGPDTLRGFRPARFRDSDLLFLSGEYRWEANSAVEFAVFYDAGKVFSGGDFDLDDLHTGWGGGVRFKSERRAIVRLDVGHSDEGTFVYFRFGPSF